MILRTTILLFILFLFTNNGQSQVLERKAYLGIGFVSASTENDQAENNSGVLIKIVMPNSAAANVLEVDDIITKYNSKPIENRDALVEIIKNEKVGNTAKVNVFRAGKELSLTFTYTAQPKISNPNYKLIYDEVSAGSNTIRSFVSKPIVKQKKHPAAFIIQGIGCPRMESFLNTSRENSFQSMVDSLNHNGFVTMHMDRSGAGDSQGTPCEEIGFHEDLNNFKAGLEKLKSYDFVDQDKIFIIGLSMGGVMAPILAKDENLAGIIVYGTASRDWYTYELENTFRQALLEETPPEDMLSLMKKEHQRLHYFLTEKKTPEAIKMIDKEMGESCEDYPLHYSYFQEVADLDIYKYWAECNTETLSIHGSSDYVSFAFDHELIADFVNKKFPGKAIYKEFPMADHWMYKTASEAY